MHLHWPGCHNVRDLGGLPAGDGRVVRTGALIRSDGHHKLTPAGITAVEAAGIGRIVDVRTPEECGRTPSPFAGSPSYRNVPVQLEADRPLLRLPLSRTYLTLLDLRPDLFAAAVIAIATSPPGPVVVSCLAGQDRTGLVVALALGTAGVPAGEIAADYALTEERLRDHTALWADTGADAELQALVRALHHTPPENMLGVLDHLDTTYGGVDGYLEQGGCTAEHRASLRHRLTTRSRPSPCC